MYLKLLVNLDSLARYDSISCFTVHTHNGKKFAFEHSWESSGLQSSSLCHLLKYFCFHVDLKTTFIEMVTTGNVIFRELEGTASTAMFLLAFIQCLN